MVGLEALSMQGLPVDELLLTRETEDQLADLAGNAMSTTVVGTCILAALVVGHKLLKEGSDNRTYEQRDGDRNSTFRDDDAMEVDAPPDDVEAHITGEDRLEKRPLNLASSTSALSLKDILEEAKRSVRLCGCEGRKDMTDRLLNRCVDCGFTSCVKCGGRPEHSYEPIDLNAHPRLPPSKFEKDLKALLPMSLSLSNVSAQLLNKLAKANGVDLSSAHWTKWHDAVLRAAASEFRFVEPKRQETWSVIYQSPTAALELSLHPQQPEWRLFAFPPEAEPANAEIRRVLERPVGRLSCTDGLFSGRWDFALPVSSTAAVTIEGGSQLVPSWEQKLGLQGEEFKTKTVHAQLEVSVPPEYLALLDRNISGTYRLIDQCGTANSALHKRVPAEADAHLPPIFLLLDPTRCGDGSQDSFVFSTSARRYEYGEARPIIALLEPKWRQSDVEGTQTVTCIFPCRWVDASDVKLTVSLLWPTKL